MRGTQFQLEDYIGKRFGQRVVIGPAERRGKAGFYVLCRCDAGHEKWIRCSHLKAGEGNVCKTCHCQNIAREAADAIRHPLRHTPTYHCWRNMRSRVRKDESYVRRGIKVCWQWESSFDTFLADMGEQPSPGMEVDRINGHGNYEPSNCRWVTHEQNNANRTNLRLITFDGKTMCVAHWEKHLGVKLETLRKKLRFNRPLEVIMAELGYRKSA